MQSPSQRVRGFYSPSRSQLWVAITAFNCKKAQAMGGGEEEEDEEADDDDDDEEEEEEQAELALVSSYTKLINGVCVEG